MENMEHASESRQPESEEVRSAAEPKGEVLSLPASIVIAAILVSSSLFYYAWSMQRAPAAPAPAPSGGGEQVAAATLLEVSGRDVILGEADAPVTIIEYGDYQCSFCGRFFTETEPLIKDNYVKTGQVRLVYRDLGIFAPESPLAAAANACARDQGKFWPYHDALYSTEVADGRGNNGSLNRDLFLKLAADLQMDMPSFTQCVDSGKYTAEVKEVAAAGQAAGLSSTPTFFVNGQMIIGAQPYATFKAAIDAELAKAAQ